MTLEKIVGAAMGNGHADSPPTMKAAATFFGARMLVVYVPLVTVMVPFIWHASSEWANTRRSVTELQTKVEQLRVEMKTEVRGGLDKRMDAIDKRIDAIDSEIRDLLKRY